MSPRGCENCGVELDHRRKQARYCSSRCRAAASRARRAVAAGTRQTTGTLLPGNETARGAFCGLSAHEAQAVADVAWHLLASWTRPATPSARTGQPYSTRPAPADLARPIDGGLS